MNVQRAGQIARWIIPTGARLVFGVIFVLEGTQKTFGWWSGSPTGSGHPEPFLNWPYWWAGVFELTLGVLLTVGLLDASDRSPRGGNDGLRIFLRTPAGALGTHAKRRGLRGHVLLGVPAPGPHGR